MKYFIVLISVFAAFIASDAATNPRLEAAKATCITEKNLDKNVAVEAERGHFKDGDNLNCYAECIFNKIGFSNADGSPNIEAMKAMAKEYGGAEHGARNVAAVEKCVPKTGKDACESAHIMFRCYWEEVNA